MQKSANPKMSHTVPADMKAIIKSSPEVLATWDTLTDITKNEWICWVTIVKKKETRAEHLKRLQDDLGKGKRRPCCWPGCPHRNPNAAKYFRKPKA